MIPYLSLSTAVSTAASTTASIALSVACALPAQVQGFEKVILPIEITYQQHNEQRPWEKLAPGQRSATGVVIKGNRILIAAQAVRNATDITAVNPQGQVFPAQVIHVDWDINLALLNVKTPGFFKGLRPARIARNVPTSGLVKAVFWNNRQLDYSEHYAHGVMVRDSRASIERSFLALDAVSDAWSQPMFSNLFGRLVGIAVSSGEEYAYAIPAEILGRYVAMTENPSEYKGFPGVESSWQFNAHKPQAEYLESKPEGIVVTEMPLGSTFRESMLPRDVLLSLDGHSIGTDGRYEDDKYGRLKFHAIVGAHKVDDIIKATVLRNGQRLQLALKLNRWRSRQPLIPWRRIQAAPPFAVRGGLVFRELDGNYMRSFGSNWKYSAPSYLAALYGREAKAQTANRRRLVILASVLPDAYNIGYHDITSHPVQTVNGQHINGIASLIAAFESPQDGFHVITLAPGAQRREIVLDATSFARAQAHILKSYAIPIAERLSEGEPTEGKLSKGN